MVYAQTTTSPWSIWRAPGRASRRAGAAEKLIASSQWDIAPSWSPDGRRIAFESARSGAQNVWICDADGSHPIQLTSFPSYTGTPHWSPDSRRIVFDSVEAGDWNVYVIDAEGGIPHRLTPEPSDEYRGVWSRDGRWIYFGSNRGGRPGIWRIPAEGGPAVQVTRRDAVHADMSWDGRHLYYVSPENDVWRLPLAGGEETEVLRGQISYHSDWTIGRSGLYFSAQRAREYAIRVLDFETGEVRQLFRKEGPFAHHWLAVSPDEQWVLYGEQPFQQSELMMVENFC
jgi:Tol biopolymer transport system component